MYLGIVAGLGLGAALSYFGALKVAAAFGGGANTYRGSLVGGVIATLPAFFLAFVFGGNLGGGYSASLLGSPVPGVALGMAAVFSLCTLLGSVLGSVVARAAHRV